MLLIKASDLPALTEKEEQCLVNILNDLPTEILQNWEDQDHLEEDGLLFGSEAILERCKPLYSLYLQGPTCLRSFYSFLNQHKLEWDLGNKTDDCGMASIYDTQEEFDEFLKNEVKHIILFEDGVLWWCYA